MNARRIALMAVGIAIVTVVVSSVRVPIPATGGYTHPGAVVEVFVALAFGPVVGMVAAGVGAAIADVIGGWGSFAPLTLVAHGALGLLAGWIGWKRGWVARAGGWIAGGLALVALYFLGEVVIYGYGVANATAELGVNLAQVALGVLGLALLALVRRAYPRLEHLADDAHFTEAPAD